VSHLADHFREKRRERDLSFGDLARQVGYKNISKGGSRISTFERTGHIDDGLLSKLAAILDVDQATIDRLIALDRQEYLQEWEKWVNEPVPMIVVLRLMAAIYNQIPVPNDIKDPEEAESWAAALARRHHRKACLVVSRRLTVWFDEDGKVCDRKEQKPFEESNIPYMRIGGRRFLLRLGDKPKTKSEEQ
jgi:hypothetical protein